MTVQVVSRSHHLDEGEPDSDGMVGYSYEYDLLVLRAPSGLKVTARSYSDTPHQVALLRFAQNGEPVGQGDVQQSHMEAVSACADFLRGQQFTSVQWLGSDGYVEVPD